jgi:hypothetical protein
VTHRFSRMNLFVTYRREDSAAYAGRLHDLLVEEFGDDHVFQDVAAIAPGEDFEVAIDAALDEADAVLVVIGPNWLAPSADGLPRLHDAEDYVRIEVSRSLARSIRVVPVLVGGAALPSATELPEAVGPLARRQAVQLRDTTWHDDVEGLIRHLRGESPARRGRLLWVAAAGLVLIATIAIWALLSDPEDGGSDVLTGCPTSKPEDWTTIFVGEESVEVSGNEGTMEFDVSEAWYQATGDGDGEIVLVTTLYNVSGPPNYDHDQNRYHMLLVDDFPGDDEWCFTGEPPSVSPGQRSQGFVGFTVTREPEESLGLVVALGSGPEATVEIALTSA